MPPEHEQPKVQTKRAKGRHGGASAPTIIGNTTLFQTEGITFFDRHRLAKHAARLYFFHLTRSAYLDKTLQHNFAVSLSGKKKNNALFSSGNLLCVVSVINYSSNFDFKKKTDIFPILSVGDTIIVPGHAEARLLTIAPHLHRQLNLTGRFQVHLKIRSVNI